MGSFFCLFDALAASVTALAWDAASCLFLFDVVENFLLHPVCLHGIVDCDVGSILLFIDVVVGKGLSSIAVWPFSCNSRSRAGENISVSPSDGK